MVDDNRYRRGAIYKIVDVGYNKCCIGSTTETLARRLASHKKEYKCFLNHKRRGQSTSFLLFEEYGLENCKIELVELFPCNSRVELCAREGHHIRSSDCVNKTIPGRTRQEYRLEYYAKNKEAIQAQTKQYKHDNKEIVDERNRVYYVNNREAITEKRSVKFVCPCGGSYQASHRSYHFRTTKHKTWEDTTA